MVGKYWCNYFVFKNKWTLTNTLRPTRGWNRPGLRPGGKAHSVFDGACCILNLERHSRPGGSTANRWATTNQIFVKGRIHD